MKNTFGMEPLLEFRGRTSGRKRINQCCHSVMKKTQILAWKIPENNKKPETYKMFKKSQNQLEKQATGTCTSKLR